MDIYEEAVLEYLTHEGKVFVCPQFRGEGFDADFVALNFEDNPAQIEIIEVSEAYNLRDLVKKLSWYQGNGKGMNSCRNRWPELKGLGLTDTAPLVIRVFIQRKLIGWFREHLNGLENVKINSLDNVFAALLDWKNRTLASEG